MQVWSLRHLIVICEQPSIMVRNCLGVTKRLVSMKWTPGKVACMRVWQNHCKPCIKLRLFGRFSGEAQRTCPETCYGSNTHHGSNMPQPYYMLGLEEAFIWLNLGGES